ncbi:MAG: GNAT family N-acetyltransferase [bacterium]|nr:GNAT family N-acetyltransferase [bacterium]MDD4459787.1 GNAT family N-acetyltransferase [Proteiniphilum sp.]
MIRFADEHTREAVRAMWKTCFGDPDDYMDLYFRHKYRDEQTLLYLDGGKPVASLQMLPYRFTFHGSEIPILYLSGVCTLPEARKKGFMQQLLLRSFEVAREREIPLMLLVPQEEWLLTFYAKYGFAQTFDAGSEPLPSIKTVLDAHPGDLEAAYRAFDCLFRGRDMTLQKSFDDFRAMAEEAALYDFPSKKNLIGMARIIEPERLLQLYAATRREAAFSLTLDDSQLHANNGAYSVSRGVVIRGSLQGGAPHLQMKVRELVCLLLGYHTASREAPLVGLFPERVPVMHYMLE